VSQLSMCEIRNEKERRNIVNSVIIKLISKNLESAILVYSIFFPELANAQTTQSI
jgi:hypothetical protein